MQRQRGSLVPVAEVLSDLNGPVAAIRDATPQAVHHFTRFDQVNQLVEASEADPDMGFMARLLALCSLPRTNPGNRLQYKRVNGPYKLIMIAGGDNKLPFGNMPRLLLAWVCTEAVRTQSRELVLGSSLAEFMRKLGISSDSGGSRGERTRLRNQIDRLFHAYVSLIYEDGGYKESSSSLVADRVKLWWDPRRPDERVLFDSKIELGEKFFQEIIQHPVPLDMNTLKALKRCSLGLDLYLWLTYRDLHAQEPATPLLAAVVPPVRGTSGQVQRKPHCQRLPPRLPAGVEEDQNCLAGLELRDGQGRADPLALNARRPFGAAPSACAIA